jgi:DNA-binding protein H-NS
MTDGALAKLSLDDLWSLHEQVCSILEQRLENERRKLQHRLDEVGRMFGSTPADIPQRRPYPRVEPKFRNPEDPSTTWSGRGKQPRWVIELLAAGGAIEDYRILEVVS